MRAFLSHSSLNKTFVQEVFNELGPANAEFDEATFSAGAFNTEVIAQAVRRCDIFALFATRESVASGYVEFEIRLATEYLASKSIKKIVTFCLDGIRPEQLPGTLSKISAVRHELRPGACARFLKTELIELEISSTSRTRPYIGREKITQQIKDVFGAPDKRIPIAAAFSGVDGVGRRTLATKVLMDVFPNSGQVPPSITVYPNFQIDDLHSALLELSGARQKLDLFAKVDAFLKMEKAERLATVVDLIKTHYAENETVFLIDRGGLLLPDGRLIEAVRDVLSALRNENRLRPYLVFILFRTPPAAVREDADLILYFRVERLEHDDIRNLISLHLKRKSQTASATQVDRLVELTDGHPYNIQYLLSQLDVSSLQSLIEDPADLIAFKKRQGDEFISRLHLEARHAQVMGVLRALGQCPIELIVVAVDLPSDELARAIRELEEYHCIERIGNVCSLNRPLRTAIERSSKFKMIDGQVTALLEKVFDIMAGYQTEDLVSINVISVAARAALFLNKDDRGLQIFLSPASSIFVGRQLYDLRKYSDCARACESVLSANAKRFVSAQAFVEAVRLRCLSLARMGNAEPFNQTISRLDEIKTIEARATKAFLEGFRFRLQGNLQEAIEKYEASHALVPNSFSTLRELSHALLLWGDVPQARIYSNQALDVAPTNPYVLDLAIAIRVSEVPRVTRDIIYEPELSDLLERLERFGDEEGKSFYSIRMADINLRAGDFPAALDFARRATLLTPWLFGAHSIEAQTLMRMKKIPEAQAKVRFLEKLIEDRRTGEWNSHVPELIQLKVDLLIEREEYEDAIGLLRANERRMASRVGEYRRKIAHLAGSTFLPTAARQWLLGT